MTDPFVWWTCPGGDRRYPPLADGAPLYGGEHWPGLVRFLATWGDYQLHRDTDTITKALGTTREMVSAVEAYVRLRRSAPGWKPHRLGHLSNHKSIPEAKLAGLEALAVGKKTNRKCASCGGKFWAKRANSRTCSPKCRKAASRAA